MSGSPFHIALIHVRRRALAVMAASLIYAGLYQIVSTLKYPIGSLLLRLINTIIVLGFRDRLLLPDYGSMPWWIYARSLAMAIIAIVLGIFIGLWVSRRNRRKSHT